MPQLKGSRCSLLRSTCLIKAHGWLQPTVVYDREERGKGLLREGSQGASDKKETNIPPFSSSLYEQWLLWLPWGLEMPLRRWDRRQEGSVMCEGVCICWHTSSCAASGVTMGGLIKASPKRSFLASLWFLSWSALSWQSQEEMAVAKVAVTVAALVTIRKQP